MSEALSLISSFLQRLQNFFAKRRLKSITAVLFKRLGAHHLLYRKYIFECDVYRNYKKDTESKDIAKFQKELAVIRKSRKIDEEDKKGRKVKNDVKKKVDDLYMSTFFHIEYKKNNGKLSNCL